MFLFNTAGVSMNERQTRSGSNPSLMPTPYRRAPRKSDGLTWRSSMKICWLAGCCKQCRVSPRPGHHRYLRRGLRRHPPPCSIPAGISMQKQHQTRHSPNSPAEGSLRILHSTEDVVSRQILHPQLRLVVEASPVLQSTNKVNHRRFGQTIGGCKIISSCKLHQHYFYKLLLCSRWAWHAALFFSDVPNVTHQSPFA